MSVLFKVSRLPRNCGYSLRIINGYARHRKENFSSTFQPASKSMTVIRAGIWGASIGLPLGVAVATGYSWHLDREEKKNDSLEGQTKIITSLKEKPQFVPSRKIVSPIDTTGLKLTLFQYQTCPFCCKVRVFLDYYGLSYDVVEVDPVLRSQISWSSYRKVPILLAKTDDGYQPLTDSTMIVSLLASHLHDRSQKIDDLVEYYPSIAMRDDTDKFKYEIMNKYFLMFNKNLPKDKTMNDITEERKWRKWADEVLVHTLSPNVYRTFEEAHATFNWFSEVGKWEEYFPWWERQIMVHVGAVAMWLIAKRLKKRHQLKEDVRQSLYDEINHWLRAVKVGGGKFKGGDKPNLSDLAVYGILKSIEGCEAFRDLLNNTRLATWYDAMVNEVGTHSGNRLLSS